MPEYVEQDTCKAIHKDDTADRGKLDEILVTVTQTAQWQKDHNDAHKKWSLNLWNLLMGCIALGSLISVIIFGVLKN